MRIWDVTDVETGGGRAAESILEGKITMLDPGGLECRWPAGLRVPATVARSCRGRSHSREPHVVVRGSDQTERVTATVAAASSRFAAAFEAPDGKTVLKVWDEAGNVLFTANGAPTGPPRLLSELQKVELSRDGTRLAYYG